MQTCIIFPLLFFCLLCQIALLTHWFMFQLFISRKNCGLNGKTTVCLLLVLILNPGHRWYPVTLEYSEFEYMTRLVIYHNHSPHACILHIYSRAIRNWGGEIESVEWKMWTKVCLCLRHQWHSRMWPWTLPQRSGGSWILPKGRWCWRTIGTWCRFVRMGSHCDSNLLWGHHYFIESEIA